MNVGKKILDFRPVLGHVHEIYPREVLTKCKNYAPAQFFFF